MHGPAERVRACLFFFFPHSQSVYFSISLIFYLFLFQSAALYDLIFEYCHANATPRNVRRLTWKVTSGCGCSADIHRPHAASLTLPPGCCSDGLCTFRCSRASNIRITANDTRRAPIEARSDWSFPTPHGSCC